MMIGSNAWGFEPEWPTVIAQVITESGLATDDAVVQLAKRLML